MKAAVGYARGAVHATFVGVLFVTALAGTTQTTMVVVITYASGYLAGARRGARLCPAVTRVRMSVRHALSGRTDGGPA